MKDGVKVMTYRTAQASNDMRHRHGTMMKVLQQNTWSDDRQLLKSCVRARAEQDNINHPAYGTWMADFMLRQNECRAFLGNYLNDLRVPWRHQRTVGNCRDHFSRQMACKNQAAAAIRCRLQAVHKGTRTRRCEH